MNISCIQNNLWSKLAIHFGIRCFWIRKPPALWVSNPETPIPQCITTTYIESREHKVESPTWMNGSLEGI